MQNIKLLNMDTHEFRLFILLITCRLYIFGFVKYVCLIIYVNKSCVFN